MSNKLLFLKLTDLSCQFLDIVRLCRDYCERSGDRKCIVFELNVKYQIIDHILIDIGR